MIDSQDDEQIDYGRRRFLLLTSSMLGGVAVIGIASPFILSFQPSEKAKASGAPVDVDVSKIEAGQKIDVAWQGKPVWVLNRTKEQIESLGAVEQYLADPNSDVPQQPDYCKNQTRSIKPEYLVVIGICTHLGCSPTYRPDIRPADLGSDWEGGFYCPCHGSKYDLSCRVYKSMPAPTNMIVPPHKYLTESLIRVGEEAAA